jgi:hypothetical protein
MRHEYQASSSVLGHLRGPTPEPDAWTICPTRGLAPAARRERLSLTDSGKRLTSEALVSISDREDGSMLSQEHGGYYIQRKGAILERFDEDAQWWMAVLSRGYGADFAETVLKEARSELEALIPTIPYIGGDENHLTGSLVGSARCLALYRAMKLRGRSAEETGKVLYDATKAHPNDFMPQIPPGRRLNRDQLMRRRRERAERSQRTRYPEDWVYVFVEGDGETFDYGYDFVECGTEKFYRVHGAEEFLPYYCFLDFPKCELAGLGLSRTMTLGEGDPRCDFRFKEGGAAQLEWPPPFADAGRRDRP